MEDDQIVPNSACGDDAIHRGPHGSFPARNAVEIHSLSEHFALEGILDHVASLPYVLHCPECRVVPDALKQFLIGHFGASLRTDQLLRLVQDLGVQHKVP